jgi:hypothetical protein
LGESDELAAALSWREGIGVDAIPPLFTRLLSTLGEDETSPWRLFFEPPPPEKALKTLLNTF